MGNFCSCCRRRCHRNANCSGCYNPSLLPIIQAFASGGVGLGRIGSGGGCYNNNHIHSNSNYCHKFIQVCRVSLARLVVVNHVNHINNVNHVSQMFAIIVVALLSVAIGV
jgi:hypothetical protein